MQTLFCQKLARLQTIRKKFDPIRVPWKPSFILLTLQAKTLENNWGVENIAKMSQLPPHRAPHQPKDPVTSNLLQTEAKVLLQLKRLHTLVQAQMCPPNRFVGYKIILS